MARITQRHVQGWPRGRPFRLLPRIRTLLDEIFVRLVLGVRSDETAQGLVLALRRMLLTPGNPPISLPGEGNGAFGKVGQLLYQRRQAPAASLLARAVDERRRDPDGTDILSLMVQEQPNLHTMEIVEELMSTLMAAQEPPSIALSRVLEQLSRRPAAADQFTAKPESPAGDAILKETLRLYPPAAGVLRRLTQPMPLGNFVVPAGATVILPIALVQRDSRVWAEPDEFLPERWHAETVPRDFHFPFGGGARRCVGESLAMTEIRTVVPEILGRLKLKPLRAESERPVVRGTVLVPHRSLLVTASAR